MIAECRPEGLSTGSGTIGLMMAGNLGGGERRLIQLAAIKLLRSFTFVTRNQTVAQDHRRRRMQNSAVRVASRSKLRYVKSLASTPEEYGQFLVQPILAERRGLSSDSAQINAGLGCLVCTPAHREQRWTSRW